MMRYAAPLLASVALAAMAGPAIAQSGPESGADQPAAQVANDPDSAATSESQILVTARRREERLSDVPSAVSVITAESLAERGGATSTLDLLSDQPSVRFNNLSSTVTSEISIRASSTARATNGDPSVGLYRNGAYIGGGAIGGRNFTRLDFLDVGRVEVLRGTQGALYGRNAVGGAVNIISAQPEFDNTGFFKARYLFETQGIEGQAAANFAANDSVAFRISADGIDERGGYFYNPENDRYFDKQKGYGVRAQARLRSGPGDFTLLVETQELTTPGIPFRVVIPAGSPGFPGGYIQPQFSYPWNTEPDAEQDVQTYQVTGDLDLGGATLAITSNYRRRYSAYDLDSDGVNPVVLAAEKAAGNISPRLPIDPNASSFTRDVTSNFFQDVHLSGESAAGRMTWLVGADLVVLDSDYSVTTTNSLGGTFAPARLNYNSFAGYGSLGYDLTDALNVTGEVRYTSDNRSLTARAYNIATGAPVGGAARMVDAETSPENFSYNATVSYDIADAVLAYGKVGTSYRAGGFNTNLGDPRQPVPIPAAYDDENATSYEIGVRGSPTPSIYFAIAGYYNQLDDLIAQSDNGCAVTVPQCPIASTSFLTNAGNARSYGVEGEVTFTKRFADSRLRATLSASHQDGEVTSGQYDGLPLPQVPDFLGSVNVNYRHELGADAAISANVFYTVQTGGVQELRTTTAELDDFDLLNLRAAVEFGRFTISAFLNNAFDQRYIIAQAPTIERYSIGRQVGVEARIEW